MDPFDSKQQAAPRKRRKRFDTPGHAHALTFSCFHNQPLLKSTITCEWMIAAIDRARNLHGFDLWAYVLMPTHAHLLIAPEPYSAIGSILKSIKQSIARRAATAARSTSPNLLEAMRSGKSDASTEVLRFWQAGGGYDRNLWSPRPIWNMIDYIHANPVRAGLCKRAVDWRWSSAAAYILDINEPLEIDRKRLPMDPR